MTFRYDRVPIGRIYTLIMCMRNAVALQRNGNRLSPQVRTRKYHQVSPVRATTSVVQLCYYIIPPVRKLGDESQKGNNTAGTRNANEEICAIFFAIFVCELKRY